MSYHVQKRPLQARARARRQRGSLGDDASDLQACSNSVVYSLSPTCKAAFPNGPPGTTPEPSETEVCRQAANSASAPFDAKIADVSKNWNPSGYYSPDQITKVVGATMQLVMAAGNLVTSAKADWSGSQSDLTNE